MATVYAKVNGITRSATENAEVSPIPGGANVSLIAEYETAATATATIVDFCTIPANCAYRVRQLNHDAQGAATSIVVGITGDTDQQIESVSTVAAGVAPANTGGWKQTDSALNIIGTLTGTHTGTLQLEVEYHRRALPLTI